MINHIKWIEDPKTFSLSEQTEKNLQSGYIYIAGVDKQMRPTCVFNVDKIDLNNASEESIIPAYSRIFKIMEEYYYYKSKIENWNVIIETNEISALQLPISLLGKIITTMQSNFPSNLNRICILNPSYTLNVTWKAIEFFINETSRKKISFLKKNEFHKLLEFYDPDQLEERFGGTAPNVTKYYPPQKFKPSVTILQKVSQTRASIQRNQQNIMDSGNQDFLQGSDFKYRQSQNPSLYQSAAPEQYKQSLPQDIYLLKSPSLQVNQDTQPQQNYGSKSQTLQQQQFQNYRQSQQNDINNQYASTQHIQEQKNEINSSPLRFNKSHKDNYNTVTIQPPGFRNELAEKMSVRHVQLGQQTEKQTISKYNIVNEMIYDQRNILDDLDDQEDKVKRSKKNNSNQAQQSTNFEGNEPKDSINYMKDLKDQNYNACKIF